MTKKRKVRSQLSRGILEMKFMKKSKEKLEYERKEEEGREVFAPDLKEIKKEGHELIIEPSLVPIDKLLSGRMSFKGMNPEVERLMELERQCKIEKEKEQERIKSNQPDIPDEEMAQYLRRKVSNNNNTSKRTSNQSKASSSDESSEDNVELPKRAKFVKPVDSD